MKKDPIGFSHCAQNEVEATPYQYKECGLDNIWLVSGFECEEFEGEEYVRVLDPDALHRAIALALVQQVSTLDGKEIRFLRKELDITQVELAALLEVTAQTVARWEKDEVPFKRPSDLFLRGAILSELEGSVDVKRLAENLAQMDKTEREELFKLEHEDSGEWKSYQSFETA